MNKKLASLLETVLRESGKLPLSSEEALEECERRGIVLVPEYIDERSSPRAAIQDALERLASLPGSAMEKLVSGPVTKFSVGYQIKPLGVRMSPAAWYKKPRKTEKMF